MPTCFGPNQRFSGNGCKSTLVELRGDGSQTMIPPSLHPDGSRMDFTNFDQDEPEVEYADLLKSVLFLAVCPKVNLGRPLLEHSVRKYCYLAP